MCHAYGRLGATTHHFEGFNSTGFNRRVANRGEYDIDGHYRGHQPGCGGEDVSDDGRAITARRAPASGVNGSRTGVFGGEKRASNEGSASGTVRTLNLADMVCLRR